MNELYAVLLILFIICVVMPAYVVFLVVFFGKIVDPLMNWLNL